MASRQREKLTELDASSSARPISEMRVDGELIPPDKLLYVKFPGEIVPVATPSNLQSLAQKGEYRDKFFKNLRESGYSQEMKYITCIPEVGSQQGVIVILSLCAEVALKVSEEYPFLSDEAFRWLESKFSEQGLSDYFHARWIAYQEWVAQGNHIYFRWSSGSISIYWLGGNPKKRVSHKWRDNPVMSPKLLDKNYCLAASLLDSRLR